MKNAKLFKTLLKLAPLTVAALLAVMLCSCGPAAVTPSDPTQAPANNTAAQPDPTDGTTEEDPSKLPQIAASEQFTKYDTTIAYNPAECTVINLAQDGTTVSGSGAAVDGNKITVSAGGDYLVSGTLTDGQIVVTVEKTEKVRLIFKGVSITNKSQACVYVTSADKVCITLANGTENTLTDGSKYTGLNEKDEPNGCLFCKDDLTINGYGSLTVNANYNNGIVSKNDLRIVSGTISVKAKNNAVKAKDSFRMNSGTLTLVSDDDAIKVNGDDDISKGYILIEGGNITITAEDDALTASFNVTVSGGTVTTYVGGQAVNCSGTVSIAEGCLIEK